MVRNMCPKLGGLWRRVRRCCKGFIIRAMRPLPPSNAMVSCSQASGAIPAASQDRPRWPRRWVPSRTAHPVQSARSRSRHKSPAVRQGKQEAYRIILWQRPTAPALHPGPVIVLGTDARLVAHQSIGGRQADLSSLNVLNLDGRLLLHIRALRFDHARRARRAYQEKHYCEWSPHGTPPLRRIRARLAPSGGPSQLDSAAPLGG